MRLDKYLVENGFFDSRNKALDFIQNQKIKVNGEIVSKASYEISENVKVDVLDIGGSSTGRFIEVLLEFDCTKVVGVDVGDKQLHKSLKENPKVISVENLDIRDFDTNELFDIVTYDVSFIGVEKVLSSIDKFAKNEIVILFKPQFQVGKNVKRDKKGVIKDDLAIMRAVDNFEIEISKYNWNLISKKKSTTKGKEGNSEEFYYFKK